MILLLDNYDSFTYNLVHYLAELGAEVSVIRNDAIDANTAAALKPSGIVISPGPGNPDESGACLEIIEKLGTTIPLLGVCLGHQCIGQVFGGKVIRAPLPIHGKTSDITHTGKSVFRNLPSPFKVTRYHSLVVEKQTLPECLEITAETSDGLIMGLMHKQFPIHGVQFHPESIASEHGHDIIRNFLDTTVS